MKKIFISLVVLMSLMLSFPLSAFAGTQDFTVVNNTGYEIDHVYVDPSSSDSWTGDILGQDTLADTSSVDITFPDAATSDLWDLKVVYSDGSSHTWNQLNLAQISTVTLTYDADTDTTHAETN